MTDKLEYQYTAPDFWTGFACKCGDCRRSCCEGWDISISEDEYFRLIGVDCLPQLRRRLDDAFYVPHDAAPERYAILNHNYLGDCPLRLENGLCGLQRELGEAVLPRVCRLYPRSIDAALSEATLANSCEGVLEGFFHRDEPIRFEQVMLEEPALGVETRERLAVRMRCIALMQDRRLNVRYRIASIGDEFNAAHPKSVPFAARLSVLLALAEIYSEISPSISEHCANAHAALADLAQEEYAQLAIRHDERFPMLGRVMEHTFVNHMFYEKFPYTAQADGVEEAFASLCGVYGFIRLLCVGNSQRLTSEAALVDMLGAAFRVVEHTRFDHNVDVVLRRLGGGIGDADTLLML